MLNDVDFQELLEKYDYNYSIGDVVKGRIVSIEKDCVFVDIKAKANACCPIYEVLLEKNQNLADVFEVNQEYDFMINSAQDENGVFYLSYKKVAICKNIEILKEKFENNETIKGTVINITKGGAIVSVMGIRGFVPLSHLRVENVQAGQEIELKVLSIDTKENNFIFSNKKVYSQALEEVRKDILEKIELNMVIKGSVVRLTDFGAFIDIGGLDGLLPLSQISWGWIDNPADILKCGEKIDVEIIGIDKEKQRVSLSLRNLQENPWPKAQDFIKDKETLKGKVTRIKPFGTFIEIYPNVEGLINNKQIKEYTEKYNKPLNLNDELEVKITRFDAQNQKINLEII